MKALRLFSQIKKAIPLLSHQSFAPFSFSSSATNPSSTNFFSDQDEGGITIYQNSLKFQRPKTVHWRLDLWNFICFIGTVMNPFKVLNDDDNCRFGVWTLLNVRGSLRSNGSCRWFSMEFRVKLYKFKLGARFVNYYFNPYLNLSSVSSLIRALF